ncbi:MAG: hypothetical protein L6Q76_31190 [Polyangiaceae bacterium]|nr:hypothetical protein [Polyangiaceae bacterium]
MTGIGRPRWGRRAAALGVLLASALARGAEAAPSSVERLRLTWSAIEGCPSEKELLAEVAKLLGEKARALAEPIPVKAAVSRDANGSFTMRLETPGEGGTLARELRGSTCKAVTDAAALILALMIDPDAATTDPEEPIEAKMPAGEEDREKIPAEPEPASPPQPETPPTLTSAPPSRRASTQAPPLPSSPRANETRAFPRTDRTPPIDFRVNAWAGADIGSLPGVAPGFGALGSVALGIPRLSLGFAVWPKKAGTLDALPSAGSDVEILAGEFGACAALLRKPIEIAPCAAVEIGRIAAEGFGVPNARTGASVWGALKGGSTIVWRPFETQPSWSRIGLTTRIELVIPLVRPRFVIEGTGPVHTPAAVAGRGALGIEITL